MAKVKIIEANGNEHEIEIANGQTLMQGAVDNMIEGIVAECGGACSCATCHCYVDEAWIGKVGAAEDMELELVECAPEPRPNSRLSCQVVISDDLEGLVVKVPQSQY